MATVRNNRTGETITTDFDHAEAARLFAEEFAGQDDHWLWFWIHRYASQRRQDRNGAPAGRARSALTFLGDTFVVAIGQGLKRPMVRVHYRGQRFKFYLSGRGTVCLKSGGLAPLLVENFKGETVAARYHAPAAGHPADCRGCVKDPALVGQPAYSHDPVGDEEYVGCLLNGDFLQARNQGQLRPMTDTEREFLDRLVESPVSFLAACSKDMGRCCYCNQPLEDARSKRIGYGKICAGRWGLPWGDAEYMEKAPSFSKVYNDEAAAVVAGIRSNPADQAAWDAFADWLEERDLPRCKKPASTVTLPRNG